MECLQCGTCCVAPDIAALDKPVGVRCAHLTGAHTCAIYAQRPEICRAHRPDEICLQVRAATLEERVQRYLQLFGLEQEARQVRESGTRSMVEARRGGR